MLPRVSSCPRGRQPGMVSSFVNPMTALAMVETMRREGHSGLVHTAAAASKIGQMLIEDLPKGRGSADQYRPGARPRGAAEVTGRSPCLQFGLAVVLDGSRRRSEGDLGDACVRRHGWRHASESDSQWHGESGQLDPVAEYSRYGSTVHKQVYIYGGLDTGPTTLIQELRPWPWSVGGWLAHPIPNRASGPRPLVGSGPVWPRSSPRRSRVPTPGRFHSPACSTPMRSTVTSSRRLERSSS